MLWLAIVSFYSFAAAQSALLAGTAFDEGSGRPVPAAIVKMLRTPHHAQCDESGGFTLGGLQAGRYDVRMEASGYLPITLYDVTVTDTTIAMVHGKLRRVNDLFCDSCPVRPVILGRIVDAYTGNPVPDVSIQVAGSKRIETSDDRGLFATTDLKKENCSITVRHPDYKTWECVDFPLETRRVTDMTITLEPVLGIRERTGILSGVVADAATGLAMPGAAVTVVNTRFTAVSDENGFFAIDSMQPGLFAVVVARAGFRAAVSTGIRIGARDSLFRQFLLTGGSDSIAGSVAATVVAEDGTPVAGVSVVGPGGQNVLTNENGVVAFTAVAEGDHRIIACRDGYDTAMVEAGVFAGQAVAVVLTLVKHKEIDMSSTAVCAGVVADRSKGVGIIGASVVCVKGRTRVAGVTDASGRYRITGLEPGTWTVVVGAPGFQADSATGIVFGAGSNVGHDVALAADDVKELARLSVRGTAVRNTDAALLASRQQSFTVSDAIGAAEISKSGAGNAADAMKQVTGATVVDGKYVFIRGIGERYNMTMLDGSEVPSTDPDRRTVPLDIFPSQLIDNVNVVKTATPDLPGSWAGGCIQLSSKGFPENRKVSLSLSGNINTQTTFKDGFLSYEGGDLDWLAIDDGTRALPERLKDTSFHIPTKSDALWIDKTHQKAWLLDSVSKSFSSIMSPDSIKAPLNMGCGLSYGETFHPGSTKLGLLASLSYSNKYAAYNDGKRKKWTMGGNADSTSELVFLEEFNDDKSSHDVLWGGLGSVQFAPVKGQEIGLVYLYTRSGEDVCRFINGKLDDSRGALNTFYESSVLHYKERTLNSMGFHGEHTIPPLVGSKIGWRFGRITSSQEEPDARYFSRSYTYFSDEDGNVLDSTQKIWAINNTIYPYPNRYWRDLDEKNIALGFDVSMPVKIGSLGDALVKAGFDRSNRERTFNERRFDFQQGNITYHGQPDSFFMPQNMGVIDTAKGVYKLGNYVVDQTARSNSYEGTQKIVSCYLMTEMPLPLRFRAVGGVRFEATRLDVGSVDTGNPLVKKFGSAHLVLDDVLPSGSLIWAATKTMNIRAAYGRTLARPAMRELAPYSSFEFIGDVVYYGRAELKRTIIHNADLRWEWFIGSGELVSLSGFYKRFIDPIYPLQSSDLVRPTNAPDAILYGLEFEFRGKLTHFAKELPDLSFGANCALVHSDMSLPAEEQVLFGQVSTVPSDREFPDQAPFVINLRLTYDNEKYGTTAGVYYNVFGRRLREVMEGSLPDVYEEPFNELNVTASKKFLKRFTVKVEAKNLVDQTSRKTQIFKENEYLYQENRKGRTFAAGLTVVL